MNRLLLRIERAARLIVSWGVAGALHPDLSAGALLRPAKVMSAESGELFESAALDSTLDRLVSVRKPVDSRQERLALAQRTGAVAVDMEGATIAAICRREGIPFQCVRAISDGIDHRLPAWVTNLMTADGQLAPWRTLAGLLRDPMSLPELLRAGIGFRRALKTLERYATNFEP